MDTGKIGSVETPFYDEYYHVKIVNGVPETMPYRCSPFSHLDEPQTFMSYTDNKKKWAVSNFGRKVFVVFNNDKTDFKDVLYIKVLDNARLATDYAMKKEAEKVKKGYTQQGFVDIEFINEEMIVKQIVT